jgi:hypothetical protein
MINLSLLVNLSGYSMSGAFLKHPTTVDTVQNCGVEFSIPVLASVGWVMWNQNPSI